MAHPRSVRGIGRGARERRRGLRSRSSRNATPAVDLAQQRALPCAEPRKHRGLEVDAMIACGAAGRAGAGRQRRRPAGRASPSLRRPSARRRAPRFRRRAACRASRRPRRAALHAACEPGRRSRPVGRRSATDRASASGIGTGPPRRVVGRCGEQRVDRQLDLEGLAALRRAADQPTDSAEVFSSVSASTRNSAAVRAPTVCAHQNSASRGAHRSGEQRCHECGAVRVGELQFQVLCPAERTQSGGGEGHDCTFMVRRRSSPAPSPPRRVPSCRRRAPSPRSRA